jgi:APA family basic amino acid/polyamine antiporter
LLASILILAGDFQQILSYFFFVVVLFIALTVAGLFVLRRDEFDGYRTPLYPLTPILFLALTTIVLFFIGMRDPARTLLGVAVVLIGLPVYYLVFQNKGGKTDGLDQNDPAR